MVSALRPQGSRLHEAVAGARSGGGRQDAYLHRRHAGAGRALPGRPFRHVGPLRPRFAASCRRWSILDGRSTSVSWLSSDHLGNVSHYLGRATKLNDYIGWLGANFDPSISWKDIEWVRDFWKGPMVIKGFSIRTTRRMPCGSARTELSNHGGRQLDGLVDGSRPAADRGQGDRKAQDPGRFRIRSGLDVARMLALGATRRCSVVRSFTPSPPPALGAWRTCSA